MKESCSRHLAALACSILFAATFCAASPQDGAGNATPANSVVTTGSGPYKVVIEGDAGLPTHTIYRPQDVKAVKSKLPIVSWANGGCANSSNGFRNFLSEIASHGFLVVAIGPADSVLNPPPAGAGRGAGGPRPTTKSSQLLDGIAWATAENTRDGSPYKGRIATDKVAVMGQSCGGLQTLDVSTDPRVSTSVVLSGGIPDWSNPQGITPTAPRVQKEILTKLHAPIAYIFGGPMDLAYNFCMDDFSRIQGVPAFAGSLTSAQHQGTYAEPNGGEMGRVVTAWLEWQLQGHKDAKKMFVGASCELCANSNWKVQQKDLK